MVKRGYYSEDKIRNQLKEENWLVFRASSSYGESDLVCIKPKGNSYDIQLLQVKSRHKKFSTFYFGKKDKFQWQRLYEIWKKFGIPTFFVFCFRRGRGKKAVIKKLRVDTPDPPKKISFLS